MPKNKNFSDFEVYEGGKVPIKAFTKGVPVEEAALGQLRNVASLPFIHKHVAVMPDVHFGFGATVGSVIPTKGAIIPAAVGVDIGCGMAAVRTGMDSSDLPESLVGWRETIEKVVPVGRDHFGQSGLPKANRQKWVNTLLSDYDALVAKHKAVKHDTVAPQLGTLGGGNHFVEVCLDEADRVWIMLHSGSRGVGNKIGRYFTDLAKEEMQKHFVHLPDQDLAYLPEGTQHFDDYIEAMRWAQNYALINRELMLAQVFAALGKENGIPLKKLRATDMAVNCHHNYTTQESHYGKNVWLTRKGAVCARKGVMGIIPGSMGAKSFIVEGRGNPESFDSCSHGAGRIMSRSAAKKAFTVEDHIKATEGVECRKDVGVIDETPGSYKDIDAVMAAQASLVSVKHTLKQVVCVKG